MWLHRNHHNSTFFALLWYTGGGGGGGGGGGIGGDRGISWDDPLLTNSSIFVFIEKALRTYGRTDLWMDRPSYRDARTHLKNIILDYCGLDSWLFPNLHMRIYQR